MAEALEVSDGEIKHWYLDVVEENGKFGKIFKDPESFIHRQDKICARSVHVNQLEQDSFIDIVSDIDGCVVELRSLIAIKTPVRHITVCPKNSSSLFKMQSVMKKHVDSTKYSKIQISHFMQCVGFQLFYGRDWECCVALIPSADENIPEMGKQVIRTISLETFQTLKSKFRKKVNEYAVNHIAMRTLMKNDLNDVGKMFILPDDREAIMLAMQDAVDSTEYPRGWKPVLFLFRFGEKMLQGLSLDFFLSEEIKSVTVHVGTDISSVYDIDLFWSVVRIQSLIGSRGILSSCLSFSDCGNFQSNLDGRKIDVKPELMNICKHPHLLRFVQLYADVPHRDPKTRFHPVSGCIAGGLAFAQASVDAFVCDAERYLSALNSNWILMCQSTCRIEFVIELHTVTDLIVPSDCISVYGLKRLLEEKPLLVPFPRSTNTCIQQLGFWITKELAEIFSVYKKTGNLGAIWRAFQLELAEEKLLRGRPLTFRSNQYSVNLGPGVLFPSRSLTDYLGFLALEDSTTCMGNEDSIPPVSVWTNSEVMKKCIARTVGFHDILDSSYGVIGCKLLHILLQDLYEVAKVETTFLRFEEFLFEIINDSGRLDKSGSITSNRLLEILSSPRRSHFPMVFGNIVKILQAFGLPLKEILTDGMSEMGLKLFPAVRIYDSNRNATLTWSVSIKYWQVVGIGGDDKCDTAAFSTLVKTELDRRQLVCVSKLKNAPLTLPWIPVCLRKLSREILSDDQTILVLTFISCLAFMMQGWYVDYKHLQRLEYELPITQYRLKSLEIQSKLLMANFNKFQLFRLHFSIPHKVDIKEPEQKVKLNQAPCEPNLDILLEERVTDDVICEHNIVYRQASCVPANSLNMKTRWSMKEIEFLHDIENIRCGKTFPELFEIFKSKCLKENIPVRTLEAFRRKLNRL